VDRTPLIGIVLGSDSDTQYIERGVHLLQEFAVPYEILVSSAHRSPGRTREYAEKAEERGIKVIIAVAGAAAHLLPEPPPILPVSLLLRRGFR